MDSTMVDNTTTTTTSMAEEHDDDDCSSVSEYDEDLTDDDDDRSTGSSSSEGSGSSGGYATTDSDISSCCSGYMEAIGRELEEMNRSRRDSIRQSISGLRTRRHNSLSALDTLKGVTSTTATTATTPQNAATANATTSSHNHNNAMTDSSRGDHSMSTSQRTTASEAQDRSMRFLMRRMSSSKITTYVQDKPSTDTGSSTGSAGTAPDHQQLVPPTNTLIIPPFAGGNTTITTTTTSTGNDNPDDSNSSPVIIRRRSTGDLAVEDGHPALAPQKSPHQFLQELLHGVSPLETILTTDYWERQYFWPITPARMRRYHAKVARAVRAQDIQVLRSMLLEQSKDTANNVLDACNSQGESLIHLACRRRNTDLLRFLVDEAQVSVRVRDDWGKSPLHEQCWNGRPSGNVGGVGKGRRNNNSRRTTTTTTRLPTSPYYYYHTNHSNNTYFDAVKLLIDLAPELLFCRDKRGFVPFQYIPQDSWAEWNTWLQQHRVWLRCKVQFIGYARSRDKLMETLQLAEATLKGISSASGHTTTATSCSTNNNHKGAAVA